MNSYSAYGLCIHSTLPLPDLLTVEAAPDVIVRLGKVDRVPTQRGAKGPAWWASAQEVCLYYEQIGSILLRDGREMIVDPLPEVGDQTLHGLILGAAFAILLHQRGYLILHASAVSVDGAAVAFLGNAGWGKSTAAAALHTRGHGILADDIVALALDGNGGHMVLPAFPRLKLWPQVVASLDQDPDALPRVYPGADKRAYRVAEGFLQTPVPLRCIYVLGAGESLEIEPLGSQEAFVQLVRHSYTVHILGATGAASRHFRQCAELAGCVPACRLKRQQSLDTLPDLARLIEAHLDDRPARPDQPFRTLETQRAP